MTSDVLPSPLNWPRPGKWILGGLGLLLGLWGAFTVTITSNPFNINEFNADYFICYSAADCNAGAGSGWSTGSPSNDGLSRSTPWQCPDDMQGKLAAGDVVLMGDGTYSASNCATVITGTRLRILNMTADGTAGNPIVIRAENLCETTGGSMTCTVLWDGEETDPDEANRDNTFVHFGSCSFIEFRGFEVANNATNFFGNVEADPCNDVTFDQMKIHNHGLAGILTAISYYNITVENSFIFDSVENSGYNEDHHCSHNHNVYLNGYNHTLRNNVMHSSFGGSSVTMGGACNLTQASDPPGFTHYLHAINNTFDGNGCVVTYTEPSGDKRYNANDFYHRGFSGSNCAGKGYFPRTFQNVKWQNNLFLGGQTATWGGRVVGAVSNTNAESIQVPGSCSHWPWSPGCSTANGPVGYLQFFNNTSAVKALETTHQTYTVTEYTNNIDQGVGGDGGNNLTDYANQDYRPTASSADIINQGLNTDCPATDITGAARDANCDVGAYEYIP